MRPWSTRVLLVTAVAAVACNPVGDDMWFRGDLKAAASAAGERDTLVFVEFYTRWCSWCRRLESETLTDPAARAELSGLVSVRLDAEGDGRREARRFGVESYPTMVFLSPAGEEVERIVGYLPPDRFVAELQRIRTGDTLFACLERLRDDPADRQAIQRVVQGLLERADPEGAIAKIKRFHSIDGHDHEICRRLMFESGRDLHDRLYLTAAKLYRTGWDRHLVVPPVPGVMQLKGLFDDDLLDLDPEEQADRLRQAKFDDTTALLELVDAEDLPDRDLYGAAELALRGGHYDLAGNLYEQWFIRAATEAGAEDLSRAARQLYLAHESVDTAMAMARAAYAEDPSADIADTLARLLYVDGQTGNAIALARTAAATARDQRAHDYLRAAELMERGSELDDRPAFEDYPGSCSPQD
jgi:thioredoxin-related protein